MQDCAVETMIAQTLPPTGLKSGTLRCEREAPALDTEYSASSEAPHDKKS